MSLVRLNLNEAAEIAVKTVIYLLMENEEKFDRTIFNVFKDEDSFTKFTQFFRKKILTDSSYRAL